MIDWSDCSLVQMDPDYVSGSPALRGNPRVMVDPIVESVMLFDERPEDVAEQFGLNVETVRTLVDYAESHRVASPV